MAALTPSAGGPAGGQAGPETVAGLVEAAAQLGAAAQVVPGLLSGGQGDLGDQAEHGRLMPPMVADTVSSGQRAASSARWSARLAGQHGPGDPVLGPSGSIDAGEPALQVGQAVAGPVLGGPDRSGRPRRPSRGTPSTVASGTARRP
mgnify:CR=1 FL=1